MFQKQVQNRSHKAITGNQRYKSKLTSFSEAMILGILGKVIMPWVDRRSKHVLSERDDPASCAEEIEEEKVKTDIQYFQNECIDIIQ